MVQVTCPAVRFSARPSDVFFTHAPAAVAASVSAAPITDASTTFPGRSQYM